MNKTGLLKKIAEKTGRSEEECAKIGEILDNHFVVGKNNKEKIVKDFIEALNLSEEEADELYNTCSEMIVKGIFNR